MSTRVVTCLVVIAVMVGCLAASPTVAEASGGEGGGGVSPLTWKSDLALWTGIIFLLLLAVLWKFAWGPIARGLDKREQGIADQITQAGQSNDEARKLLKEYQQKLADSEEEVRRIVEQGRRDGEQAGRDIVEKARAEAQAEHQRSLREIEAATAGSLKDLAERSAELAVGLAGRIVRAELKPADHTQLIEDAVRRFPQQKNGSK